MPEYRFYTIKKDGHIEGAPTELFVADDKTAVKLAEQRLDGHDIEIWEGPRVVAHLSSKRK